MAEEILSQEEIDLILDSLQRSPLAREGAAKKRDLSEKHIRPYDFRHPDRLTRENRKVLERIHDNFSKEVAVLLNDKLRTDVKIQIIALDQLPLDEFLEAVQTPTCLYVYELNPHGRQVVLEIYPNLAFYIVDRILGGPGKSDGIVRELTRIEQRLMRKVIDEVIEHLRSAWEQTATFEAEFRNYFSSANYLQVAQSGESVVSAVFEATIEDRKYLFSLTYPYFLIEKLVPVLERETRGGTQQILPEERKILRKNLERVTAPVVAKLGSSRLTVEEVLNLKVGDVVMLNRNVDENLELAIGTRTRFLGRAGLFRNRLAFKVLEKVEN